MILKKQQLRNQGIKRNFPHPVFLGHLGKLAMHKNYMIECLLLPFLFNILSEFLAKAIRHCN